MPYLWARLLYHRGIESPAQADAWRSPADSDMEDPFLLPDMDRAVQRLNRAITAGETIAVYGDFDADGVTGCAVVSIALERLGARVLPYIPHRVDEGHGLNADAIMDLKERGANLIVTVDCGVTDVAEVGLARELGMETIITDHHVPPAILPDAVAVVDPRHPKATVAPSPLAGVGLGLKLVQGLHQHLQLPVPQQFLQLAAIGTIADLVPLEGENRQLVAQGLASLRSDPLPGVQALLDAAGVDAATVDAEVVSFVLAPRINAAGRVEHAALALKALLAHDVDEAMPSAQELERLNLQRRALTKGTTEQIWPQAEAQRDRSILFVVDENLPAGIVGLAASRLVDAYYRPVVVVAKQEGLSKASCRSIQEFNMIEALTECRDLFTRFGGHYMAAGFEMETTLLPNLGERLNAIADKRLEGLDLTPSIGIDAEISLGAFTRDTLRFIDSMAPFGAGNMAPTFLSRNVEITEARTIGATGDHLLLNVRQDGKSWKAMAFGMGAGWVAGTERVDLVYSLGMDRWKGQETLRLMVKDWRPHNGS
jgi:single-stranded-DNA-specific exonuclease